MSQNSRLKMSASAKAPFIGCKKILSNRIPGRQMFSANFLVLKLQEAAFFFAMLHSLCHDFSAAQGNVIFSVLPSFLSVYLHF